MTSDEKKKIAKAKLYNLKSSIEGLVTMIDSDAIDSEQAMTGVTTVAAKVYDDFISQTSDS